MDIGQGLMSAWQSIAGFVPLLLGFLVILVLGWIIAWFVGKGVAKGLHGVGLDRALHRGGVGHYFERSRWTASELGGKIIYYVALLFVLTLAFNVFGPNPISELLQDVIAFLPRIIVAIVIVVVASAIAKVVKDLVANTLSGLSYGNVVATIASVFILFLGVVAALNQVGVATTVTTPVLVTILATIGGVIVVGAGGGLVRPMQSRWERWLDAAERESGNVRAQLRRPPERYAAATAVRDDPQGGYDTVAAGRDDYVDLRDSRDPSAETRRL